MSTQTQQIEYQVCYGVDDRVTFVNGVWIGDDIPEEKRKTKDLETCPFMWEFLASAGADGWELVTVLETDCRPMKGGRVRTYFLKRPVVAVASRDPQALYQRPS